MNERLSLLSRLTMFAAFASLVLIVFSLPGMAQEKAATADDKAEASEAQEADDGQEKQAEADEDKKVDFSEIDGQFMDLRSLSKKGEVWFSPQEKIVLAGGSICLNRGYLEMFACTPQTKEHESIVVLNCKAFEIHAGLMAIGAKPGKPVKFDPEYVPASGAEIEVEVHWFDKEGKPQHARAQEWIKDSKTGKAMTLGWVFAGSGFFVDEKTGERFYLAEGGEVVCVSNFTTAMLDVPVKSSDLNDGLQFEAFTERIPPVKTKVRVVFSLKSKKKKEDTKDDGKQPDDVKNSKIDSDENKSDE